MNNYIKVLRPFHWSKNLLIFVPLMAVHSVSLLDYIIVLKSFFIFSLIASSVYIFNDIFDQRYDVKNNYKKNRPIASGVISIKNAFWYGFLLLVIGLIASYYFVSILFLLIILFYFIICIFYTLVLKKIEIIDIFCISIFFTIRVITGALITNLEISVWIINFSIFLFLSLASVKRIAEKNTYIANKNYKLSGRSYTQNDLDFLLIVSTTSGLISLLIFGLYINSEKVSSLYNFPELLNLITIVLAYWIIYLNLNAFRMKINEDPIIYALKNFNSWICFSLIVLILLISKFI